MPQSTAYKKDWQRRRRILPFSQSACDGRMQTEPGGRNSAQYRRDAQHFIATAGDRERDDDQPYCQHHTNMRNAILRLRQAPAQNDRALVAVGRAVCTLRLIGALPPHQSHLEPINNSSKDAIGVSFFWAIDALYVHFMLKKFAVAHSQGTLVAAASRPGQPKNLQFPRHSQSLQLNGYSGMSVARPLWL